MIVLGEGCLGRTSLGLFLPIPPLHQVSPFTSVCVWGGGGDMWRILTSCGDPPSSGPSGTACSGREGGHLYSDSCVHLPHRRRLIPAAEMFSPLAKPPKFALGQRSVRVPAAKMRVAHTFDVV